MNRCKLTLAVPLCLAIYFSVVAVDASDAINRLLTGSCIDCHDEQSDTGFDITGLHLELDDGVQFRAWVKVFDRINRGEMPPKDASQPSSEIKEAALDRLSHLLTKANLDRQHKTGRVPSRRLTPSEYEHTLHDLLGIGGKLARYLPPKNKAATFDVVGAKQEMSSVHV